MSGLEALSLVANIISLVTLTRDVIITYKSIRDSHTPDPRLAQMCKAARDPYERIVQDMGENGPLGQEQQALVEAAQRCVKGVEDIDHMVAGVAVPKNGRRLSRRFTGLSRSVTSIWRKPETEALEKNLERYQRLVDIHLSRHILRQVQTSGQQQLESFTELKQVLKSYDTENPTIRQFILTENKQIRRCVTDASEGITRQLAATELGIRSEINTIENKRLNERTKAEQEQRHMRLLQSLSFPERNARWKNIDENYPKTFEWLFSTHKDSGGGSTGDESEDDESMAGRYGSGSEEVMSERDEFGSDSEIFMSEGDGFLEIQGDGFENEGGGFENEGGGVEAVSGGQGQWQGRLPWQDDESERYGSSESLTALIFPHWLRSDSKMFWISGKPASGKSTLMKYIATNPKTLEHLRLWSPDVRLIHHSFWKPGVSMQNSVDGMLCSLLYQILEYEPSLAEVIQDDFDPARKASHHDWSTKELKESLYHLLGAANACFCIFLDGLDEAVENLHKFDIKSVLVDLGKLDGVKICASSRPEPKFENYFTDTEQLAIHDLTQKDIQLLVRTRLKDMQIDSEFRRKLASIVERRAQGVFMWVILVLNSVQEGIRNETPDECLDRLSRMAQDLHSLYREMWDRATYHGIDPKIATLYFDIVIRRHRFFKDTAFPEVRLLELAMMDGKHGFLEESLEDNIDRLTAGKLLKQAEKTRRRIEYGCAGLLVCNVSPNPDNGLIFNPSPGKLREYACTTVDFTHRTVFDFFNDSESGRHILAESRLTDRDFFLGTLESIMFEFRYLGAITGYTFTTWAMRDVRFQSIVTESIVTEIIYCLSLFEDEVPGVAEDAEGMSEVLYEWHLKGYWHNPNVQSIWGNHLKGQLCYLKKPANTSLVEFVVALQSFSLRMADKFIQGLQASELLDALPMILYTGSWQLYGGPDSIRMLQIVRRALSRVSELGDIGTHTGREGLRRIIRPAFSNILRQMACGTSRGYAQRGHASTVTESPPYQKNNDRAASPLPVLASRRSSHARPSAGRSTRGLLSSSRNTTRSLIETIESFTKLESFHHGWDHTCVMILGFDYEKNAVVWMTAPQDRFNPPEPSSVLVTCNDLFLRNYLAASEGLQDLPILGQDASCEPTLHVICVRNHSIEDSPWVKPSISDGGKLRDMLSQVLIEGQGILSLWDQFQKVLSSINWANEPVDWEASNWRTGDIINELDDLGHTLDPWVSSDTNWNKWKNDKEAIQGNPIVRGGIIYLSEDQ